MDARLLYPNEYLYAADLKGKDKTLTISRFSVEDLHVAGSKTEPKPVLYFAEIEQAHKDGKLPFNLKLVINKTNTKQMIKLLGTETDNWIGKKITLYPTTTKFGRDTVDCIRIRNKVPA